MEGYIGAIEAAKRFGFSSRQVIYQMVSQGKLRDAVKVRGRLYVSVKELEHYVAPKPRRSRRQMVAR